VVVRGGGLEGVVSASKTEQVVAPTKPKRPKLWHKAMDEEQSQRAQRGESWLTRCGRRAKAQPKLPRAKVSEVAPMEACVVCCNLPWPGGDGA
jgi:hypothetical protein